MTISSDRAMSFGGIAQDYDRYRVGPPPEIVDFIVPGPAEAVLDLGAGTGALTRRLVGRIPQVFAVEPDERMRAVLLETCPEVNVLAGTAEQLPLPDACVDAVVVASAWHWMDPVRAVPEIARVLRPGGSFAVLWNRRDRAVPWVADLEAARRRITDSDDAVEERVWYFLKEQWLPPGSRFGQITVDALAWTAPMTRPELCGMMATFAGYIAASPERRPQLMREFAEYVDGDARLGAGDVVEVPMKCHYWRARLE